MRPVRRLNTRGAVCVVTGGASGLGRALTLALRGRGATVVVLDRQPAPGAHVLVDVTDAAGVTAAIDAVVAEHGRLDAVICSAGIDATGEALELPIDLWRRIVEVNLLGSVHALRAAYVHMVAQGHGHLVAISSGAGLVAVPTGLPYTATKGALITLMRAWQAEAEGYGVAAVVVCPPLMDTPMLDGHSARGDRRAFVTSLPGAVHRPEDVARAVVEGLERGQVEIVIPPTLAVGARLLAVVPALGRALRRHIVARYRAVG